MNTTFVDQVDFGVDFEVEFAFNVWDVVLEFAGKTWIGGGKRKI
jgi:hypothetical protein